MHNYITKEIRIGTSVVRRHFSQVEINTLPYIEPLFFIDTYFKENKTFGLNQEQLRRYCFNMMQKSFNLILRRFFDAPDKVFASAIKAELLKYSIFREIVLHNSYRPDYENGENGIDPAALVINLYHELETFGANFSASATKTDVRVGNSFRFNEFKHLGWQYSAINFLQEEFGKKLAPFVSCFLVHGSFATKDFLKNWSDLDTLIVLNDAIFEQKENLQKVKEELIRLAPLFYKIDPLAHHQFTFLTRFDINYYPPFLFPPVLYDYGLLVFGEPKMEIHVRSDEYEKIQVMAKFVNYFRNKVINQSFSKNKYHWKNDLASMMIWPSLLLQAKNIYLYKKYSFEKAKEVFPLMDFTLIDRTTIIMKNWKRINLLTYYPNRFLNFFPHIMNRKFIGLHRRFSMKARPIESAESVKELTKEFLAFAETGLTNVLKEIFKA